MNRSTTLPMLAGLALLLGGLALGLQISRAARDPLAAGDMGDLDSWSLSLHEGFTGRLFYPPGEGEPIRVELQGRGAANWQAQLWHPAPPVVLGVRYRLSFRARADRSRPAQCRVMQKHPEFQVVGLLEEVRLAPEWCDFEWTFSADRTDDQVHVVFNLGDSDLPCEISHLRMQAAP